MDDEIKFLRRPVDTLRLGLAAAREVGSSKTKHPVQAMQEEVREKTERRRSRSDDAVDLTRARRADSIEVSKTFVLTFFVFDD